MDNLNFQQAGIFGLPSLNGIRLRKSGLAAWSAHVPFGYDLVSELKPKLLVELGTHSGESYFTFCQSVLENRSNTVCYAVDTWKGDPQSGFYDDSIYADVSAHNKEFYSGFSYLLRATFDEASAQFADGTIDLLHIDGYHTYGAVRHDFDTWFSKVSSRGIILFHDIAVRHGDFGVWKFWEELNAQEKGTHRCFAFHSGWGLGVYRKCPDLPLDSSFLNAMFSSNTREAEAIRRYYVLVADNLLLRKENTELTNAIDSAKNIERNYNNMLEQKNRLGATQQKEISDLQSQVALLANAVESAEQWQRSWFKRAFHRWHPQGSARKRE